MFRSTSGVTFESKAISVLVPANSFHHVLITGRALEAGTLIIRGCLVQAPNGLSREFGLPLSTEEEEDKLMKRKTAIACEYGRTKYSGLAAHPWERPTEKRSSVVGLPSKKPGKSIRYMDFKVAPELPLLRIRRTSLTHSAVMLYNGERCVRSHSSPDTSNVNTVAGPLFGSPSRTFRRCLLTI